MHRYLFFLLASFFLFSNFTCFEDCDFFDPGIIPLEVQIENPAEQYQAGDILWLSSTFAATQPLAEGTLTIGEGGGLIVSQIFNFDTTSSLLTAGLANTSPQEDIGTLIGNGPGDDPSAAITRFTCTDGNCNYRTGFRLDSVGTYLLRVTGSSIDGINEAFRFCNDPSFGVTTLRGGNNVAEAIEATILEYQFDQSTFNNFSSIFPQQDQNLFLIRVE